MTDSAKPITSPFSFTPYKEKEGEEYMNEAQLKHFEKILKKLESRINARGRPYCASHAG